MIYLTIFLAVFCVYQEVIRYVERRQADKDRRELEKVIAVSGPSIQPYHKVERKDMKDRSFIYQQQKKQFERR